MSLLRSFWKILVGIKDALVLIALFLFFGALYVAMSNAPEKELNGGALLVDMSGVLVEQAEQVDPEELLSGGSLPLPQVQVRDVVRALRVAAKDDDIKVVVLDLDSFLGGGQVAISDVARAIGQVRAAKKPVLAFATGYGDDGYALAAQASEVWLDPMGGALIAGPGGTQPYYKRLLDRYGVKMHVFRAGKFKSYVEPYERNDMSPEAREAAQALTGALWSEWQALVLKARPKAQVAALAANPLAMVQKAGGNLAQAAVEQGLADKLGDRMAFGSHVAQLVGGDEEGDPGNYNYSDLTAYLAAHPEKSSGDAVAVVHVVGEIVDGEAPAGHAGADSVAALINQAAADDDTKALILRVDSPGGSALAAEHIRLAVEEVRKRDKIPIIVSMSNVAASGGYWVSMAGDKVFAEPSTITGSIGVFATIPSFEKALADYGVTSDGVKTTPLTGQPDLIGGLNAETDQLLQLTVGDIYRRFKALVAGRRKLSPERTEEIAQGRVWAGGDARQLGLIDAFGSLDDAVAEAARRAQLPTGNVRVTYFEPQPGFWASLLADSGVRATARVQLPTDMPGRLVALRRAELGGWLRQAHAIATGSVVQARCLACLHALPVAPPQFFNWKNRVWN